MDTEFHIKNRKRKKDKGQNRKVSDQTSSQVSPIRRKDSVAKKDRFALSFFLVFLPTFINGASFLFFL